MNRPVRFQFRQGEPVSEAKLTFCLALYAVEGLVGRVNVALDADFEFVEREIVIDESTFTGCLIARAFGGLISREFPEGTFTICRQPSATPSKPLKLQETCA